MTWTLAMVLGGPAEASPCGAARRDGSPEAWSRYLDEHPTGGACADEARAGVGSCRVVRYLPSEATAAAAAALPGRVEGWLFAAEDSDEARLLTPYFEALAEATDGRWTVSRVDPALDVPLATEWKVRDVGVIVLRADGGATWRVHLEAGDAAAIDPQVREGARRLAAGARRVAVWPAVEDPVGDGPRAAFGSVRRTLGDLWGDDAAVGAWAGGDPALVVVAPGSTAPTAEESAALARYYDDGGTLLVLLDAESAVPTELLAHLGVVAGVGPLRDEVSHVRVRGTADDELVVVATAYGDHPLTAPLAGKPLVLPYARPLAELGGAGSRVTPLVLTPASTRAESGGAGPFPVAVLAEGDGGGRAVVLGSGAALGQSLVLGSPGNLAWAASLKRWLDERPVATADDGAEAVAVRSCTAPHAARRPTAILRAPPDGVVGVRWRDARSSTTLERRQDALGAYVWVEAEEVGEDGATTRDKFVGNADAGALLVELASLHAVRWLAVRQRVPLLGLAPGVAPGSIEVLLAGGGVVELAVGGEVYGTKDHLVARDDAVYLLDDSVVRRLRYARSRFVERSLVPVDAAGARAMTLTAPGGAPRRWRVEQGGTRVVPTDAADAAPDEAAATFLEAALRLRLREYVASAPDEPRDVLLTYTIADDARAWRVEISRGTRTGTYYADCEACRGLTVLTESLARRVLEEAPIARH